MSLTKKLNPKLTLWIANPPYTDDWDELDKVKQDFSDYEKKYDVRYLGSLNPTDLVRQIKSSEYWLYPSKYPETYCITALEMMMGRVKVLSSDTGNLKDLLKDKSTLVSSFTHDNTQNQDSPFLEDNEENAKNVGLMRYTFVAAYAFSNEQGKKLNENLNKSEIFARQQNWNIRYKTWLDMIQDKLPDEARGFKPPQDSQRLHNDLYSYWDNKEEWTNKFITYSAKTKEWDLIVDEPFDSCFTFPLFTEEFCKKIREEAEHSNSWTVDRHENYPTTDMLLTAIGMDEIYNDVMNMLCNLVYIYGR